MPSTRSSAATKCISEVPGLAKQTSTPPATRVRTRLSAPFIVPLPFATFSWPLLGLPADQPLFTHLVKGVAAHCWHRGRAFGKRAFRHRWNWKLTAHAPVPSDTPPL